MKIGEWDNLGRARLLLQRQLAQLGAAEHAAHVAVSQDTGRLRILVATDAALLDYSYAPMTPDPEGAWILRGQAMRWSAVRGLRLQTDAQLDEAGGSDAKSIWRFVSEDPKIELHATSDDGEAAIEAILALARACFQLAG